MLNLQANNRGVSRNALYKSTFTYLLTSSAWTVLTIKTRCTEMYTSDVITQTELWNTQLQWKSSAYYFCH